MSEQQNQTVIIRQRLAALRGELPADLADAKRELRRKVSIQHHASRHPWIVMGLMVGLGYLLVPKKAQPRIAPQRSSSRLAGWLPDWGGRPSTKEDEVDEAVAKSSLASMLVSTLTTFALKAASTYVMNHYIKGGERQR